MRDLRGGDTSGARPLWVWSPSKSWIAMRILSPAFLALGLAGLRGIRDHELVGVVEVALLDDRLVDQLEDGGDRRGLSLHAVGARRPRGSIPPCARPRSIGGSV